MPELVFGQIGIRRLRWRIARVSAHDVRVCIKQEASHQPPQQLSLRPLYEAFLQSRVPAARLYLGLISRPGTTPALFSAVEDTTYTAATGVVDERYVALSACRVHSCDEGGCWVDPLTNTTVGEIIHFYFGQSPPGSPLRRFLPIWSKDVDQQHLPRRSRQLWRNGTAVQPIDPTVDGSTALTMGEVFVAAHYR
ncbi:hypothetical protein [Dyella sp.]|uniref:hypothetical protein n=1 Tax=Dyella sp. TaxID=1869338 RepID=UPI002ED58CCC